jgi:hypothetical protein
MKSYLPASQQLGTLAPRASRKGLLEPEPSLNQRTPRASRASPRSRAEGREPRFAELKGGEEPHPHCRASHPFVPVSPQGFERCHGSGERAGNRSPLELPATSFCRRLRPPPPRSFDSPQVTHCSALFPSRAHTSPARRTFAKGRRSGGRPRPPCAWPLCPGSLATLRDAAPGLLPAPRLSSLPKAFLSRREKPPSFRPIPFQTRFWLEVQGVFLTLSHHFHSVWASICFGSWGHFGAFLIAGV